MKTFLDSKNPIDIKQGGVVLTLRPLQMSKGTKGFYPASTWDQVATIFAKWFGGQEKLDTWVSKCFNEVCQLCWRDASEELNLEKSTKATPEQVKALEGKFSEYLVSDIEGRRSKEKDSGYYYKELVKLNTKFKSATDPLEVSKLKVELTELKAQLKVVLENEAAARRALDAELAEMLA